MKQDKWEKCIERGGNIEWERLSILTFTRTFVAVRRPFPISTRYRLMGNFHTTLFRHSTLLRHAEEQCSPSACLSTAFSVFIRLLALLSNVFEIKFEALLTFEHQNMFILCLINKKRRAIEIFPIAFQSAEIKI